MIKKSNQLLKPEYNSILFQVKRTPGDARNTFASGGIYQPPFYENYFMEKRPLSKGYVAPDKTNIIVKFFRRMYDTAIGIKNAMKEESQLK